MSANVESMFYVSNEENGRFKPWHGLGTIVADAPTSADALHLAGLDWDVVPSPVYLDNGILVPGYKANTRSSDNKVLGIVSDRYKIVQNADAFSFTDALIGDEVKYETAGSLLGGKRIWLLAKMPTEKILGDDVDPYICFTNTHDGTGSVKVCTTNVRVVCQNTLNIALSNASRCWSVRHMGNIDTRLEEARNTLDMVHKYNLELGKYADRAANTTVNSDDISKIKEILFPVSENDSNRKRNNIERNREEFDKCLNATDIKKFYGTLWGVVNAVSDFVYHTEPNRVTKTIKEGRMLKCIDGMTDIDKVVNMYPKVLAA